MEVKERLKKKVIKKVVIASMATVILTYVLYQVYKSVRHEVKTEPAIMYTLNDSIETKGIVIRNEELVYWDGNGTLMNILSDGDKVSKGGAISEIYQNEKQAACMMELREIDKEINQIKGLNMSSGAALRGPDYIDKQISEQMRNVNLFSRGGNYRGVYKAKDKLIYLLNERNVVMGKVDSFASRLDELENKRKELIKECGNNIGEVVAENSGYFVSKLDGYENYINYDDVKNLKASDLNFETSQVSELPNNIVGKIIKSVDWYLVCKIPIDDAMRFKINENVEIEISSAMSESIPAKIVSVNKDDTQTEASIVLSCDRMSKELTLIRNEDVKININTYRGLRIGKSAIKEDTVSKLVENDGVQEKLEKRVKGVYVKYGTNLIFKEVVPIYMDSSYVICKCNPNEDEIFSDSTIQPGDEVVIEGTNLYDGKHIE